MDDEPKPKLIERGPVGSQIDTFECPYCGTHFKRRRDSVKTGNTRSCGCLKELRAKSFIPDPNRPPSNDPRYKVWVNMKQRCLRKDHPRYPEWGGRGITIDPEWVKSFNSFWEDMGDSYAPGLLLDREDNDGPYCKSNCRWITPKESSRNMRANVHVSYLGKDYILVDFLDEWAPKTGLHRQVLANRLKKCGYNAEAALVYQNPEPIKVEYQGLRYSLTELANLTGMPRTVLTLRICSQNWTV